MAPITILLADDSDALRRDLRKLLGFEEDFHVVGEARNGREAVALTKKLLPTVVLMDVAMPRLDGLQATRQILRAVPTSKVIILSVHSDLEYVDEAFSSGAMGYLIKHQAAGHVCHAIRDVQRGKLVCHQSLPHPHLANERRTLEIGASSRRTAP